MGAKLILPDKSPPMGKINSCMSLNAVTILIGGYNNEYHKI